jgi:hypothetical protein
MTTGNRSAQAEEVKRLADALWAQQTPSRETFEALHAAIDRLAEDAERYRCIRDVTGFAHSVYDDGVQKTEIIGGLDLDALIDAARKQECGA